MKDLTMTTLVGPTDGYRHDKIRTHDLDVEAILSAFVVPFLDLFSILKVWPRYLPGGRFWADAAKYFDVNLRFWQWTCLPARQSDVQLPRSMTEGWYGSDAFTRHQFQGDAELILPGSQLGSNFVVGAVVANFLA
jgi:hypothetical protein